MSNLLDLSVQHFRAVRSADIQLNGITVVAGINGCGKSSLSKLLYTLLRHINDFDGLVTADVHQRLTPYMDVIEQLHYALRMGDSGLILRKINFRDLSFERCLAYVDDICSRYLDMERAHQAQGATATTPRLHHLLDAVLAEPDLPTVEAKIQALRLRIHDALQQASACIQERPATLLHRLLAETFCAPADTQICLREYGGLLYSASLANIPLPHYVRKVLYVDTPMAIGLSDSDTLPAHWRDLNLHLRSASASGFDAAIDRLISSDLLHGEALYDPSLYGRFKFRRADGREFALEECATGVRSISMLQLLLRNQFLDENTLLILDEPEAHLHPQWIVAYARLLVLLHQQLGVKFFIASHSTDMVSALRYLSDREGCLSDVTFYVAEAQSDFDGYVYRNLGQDIEPIFASFNQSLDLLDTLIADNERI
jgi:energy-coupling factor transporter ATP-binding protein EcfA2